METYKILVANSQNQKSYSFETSASTRGELKDALRENNIPYEGMSFTEGISHLTLNDDSSPLPVNERSVDYKGEQYKMIILLTNSKKNIASGAGTRIEAYQAIKEMGLKDEIKEFFDTDYTHVPTEALWDFINSKYEDDEIEDDENYEEDGKEEDEMEDEEEEDTTAEDVTETVYCLIRDLVNSNVIGKENIQNLVDKFIENEWIENPHSASPATMLDSSFEDIASLFN